MLGEATGGHFKSCKFRHITRPSYLQREVFLSNLCKLSHPNWFCFSTFFSSFFSCKTWERTLRRSRRVKRWHWTRRCCCAAIPPRECHKLRWDTDTGDIYRPESAIHLPFPHQGDKDRRVAQDQLPGISPHSTRGTDNPVRINYTSNYLPLLIYYLSYISGKLYITSSRHITQHWLGGFTPHLASLKAYA